MFQPLLPQKQVLEGASGWGTWKCGCESHNWAGAVSSDLLLAQMGNSGTRKGAEPAADLSSKHRGAWPQGK